MLGSGRYGRVAVPIVPARLGATSNNPGRDMDSIDEILGELPLPPHVTAENVTLAVKAVTVHAAEQWPDGPRCRTDRPWQSWHLRCDRRASSPNGRRQR